MTGEANPRAMPCGEDNMPDENGYPAEQELRLFDRWKLATNADNPTFLEDFHARDVVDYLETIWWYPERQIELREGRDSLWHKKIMRLVLHTGGWSGNEDIVAELEGTWFWFMYWKATHRGGHYYFEIPWREWQKQRIVQRRG